MFFFPGLDVRGRVRLDEATLRRVAELSRLSLSADEEKGIGRDLAEILEKVRQLGAAPSSAEARFWLETRAFQDLREDDLRPSLGRETVLASAPRRVDDLVEVPFPGEAT